MQILKYIHSVIDYALALLKLVQNREVGWQTLERKTGKYQREQQPLLKKLKLLLLFNPFTEWIDQTHLLRLWIHKKTIAAGQKEASKASSNQIKAFADFYHINMEEFWPSKLEEYSTFDDFFIRQHAVGSRPIFAENDPSKAVVVADSRVVVYPSVSQAQALWIKGKNFTIGNLILDHEQAKVWTDGSVASFRLSPQDYHRYHSPVAGKVKWFKQISGDYYQVDPVCLSSDVDILTRNARCCIVIQTKEFGMVLFVAIGATEVGTVEINEAFRKEGADVKKGEEIGLFKFGGSSIIVAFEKDRIRFDEDLLSVSQQRIMVDVEVGMSLGTASSTPSS
ncbi:phosphatidylserine decarboxylase-domain-containing protein [Rhexocercosporidium sp. MPI-PUGE-AT-0058]|nr:phosphatidylserine decarboxylase-domain-containing protein [Rhexocercosporidium sp. MPI-PUGE-AT-0058]